MAKVGFLNTEERYHVDVPSAADSTPDLYSIVTLDGGAREIIYETEARRTAPDEEPGLQKLFDVTQGGVRVSAYRVSGEPEQLVAFWRLPDGYLSYVLSDDGGTCDDLEAGMRTVIDHVDVALTDNGLPRLRLRAPLVGGDVRDPFQRDMIVFPAKDAVWPTIKVTQEPPWSREGETNWRSSGVAEASRTTVLDLTVSVSGPEERMDALQQYADAVAASLAPAGTE